MPGGGGYESMARKADIVAEDVRAGFIDAETAKNDYGVIVTDDFTVDADQTATRRNQR